MQIIIYLDFLQLLQSINSLQHKIFGKILRNSSKLVKTFCYKIFKTTSLLETNTKVFIFYYFIFHDVQLSVQFCHSSNSGIE